MKEAEADFYKGRLDLLDAEHERVKKENEFK